MLTNPTSLRPGARHTAPARAIKPAETVRTEWSRTVQRYEKALGGKEALCRTLGGLPESVYNSWKSGEVPPEWLQLLIGDFLDAELDTPPVHGPHPFE